jgi:hypothetical protein
MARVLKFIKNDFFSPAYADGDGAFVRSADVLRDRNSAESTVSLGAAPWKRWR